MTTFKRFLTLFLIATLSIATWGANYSETIGYSTLSSMLSGNYTDASSYWKVPGTAGNSATITIPASYFTNQPTSNITLTFSIATFGGGNNPSSSNTTITAVGSETSSTWSGSSVSTYPSSSTYVNGVMTLTKAASPTTLGGLTITMGVNTGVKIFRLQSIKIEYTYSDAPYTVTLSKNGSTTDITGRTGTYTLPTTGEHVADACTGWSWHCWTNAPYAPSTPSTTAPSTTKITTMTAAGTAYAVYKHEEASGGSSNVTFTAGTDKGSTTSTSADDMTKGGVTISSTSAALAYDDNYRLYSGSTTTISSSSGNITSIVLNSTASGTSKYGPAKLSGTGYSYSGSVGTWTGNASSVTLSASDQFRATSIVVTTGSGTTTTYTSSPECTPCDNKVTLTKGEASNGSFTLDKSNGVYNNCTSNFVVNVTGITPASGYYCSGVTATGGHNTVSGPDGSGNYTVTYEKGYSITSTITAEFTANPTYIVTWYMDGDESNTDSYEEGDDIVFPGSATGCDGKVFRGWSADPVAETDIEPTYVTSATMPAHAVTYYAVYAEAEEGGGAPVTLLSEDFSSITNGNSTTTSGSGTPWSGNDNIEFVTRAYQAGGAVRLGGSKTSEIGSIETIALTATAGSTLTVSFDVKGWTNVEGDIRVTVTGCDPEVISYTATMSGSFENKSAQFTLTSDNPTVTIATTAKRAFIDNIVITGGGGTTYSGYTTTCGAGISAQNIGWITSAAGQKVKRVINVSAKNFEDDVTLAATCANSHFAVTLGATAVPAGAGGLTTTLTVEYTPTAPGKEENVEIVLTAGDKSRTITVNGRCVPDEFLLITKKLDKWYALPANMTSGSGEYDGVEVSPNDATTPTAVPVSPSTLIYNLASVASSRYAANGNLVRLVGNNNKCLWGNKATGDTKVNIQNYAALAESNGDNYEWDLKTTDGVHYFVESPCNAEYAEGRRLAYGTKFGMYKEETVFFIVRAGCSSQPGEIIVSPRRVDATFSWVSNTTQMHIDLYTNSEMTGTPVLSATVSSSPYVFTGLAESTDYWYKLTPGDDTDCAVTGTFKTTGPIIDIVEWEENGVVLFIDKGDINPLIVIDGQEEHGSITGGGEATELFFAKYFEGAGDMKLLSIFNGTKDEIPLSGYSIFIRMRGTGDSWAPTNNVTLDLSSLGSIAAGQEIIFFTRQGGTGDLVDCSDAFLDDKVTNSSSATSNPRWVECDGGTFKRIGFNGNDPIMLYKNTDLIDIIGSTGAAATTKNCLTADNEKGWAGTVRNMDKGKSPSDPAFNAFYQASSNHPVTTQDSIDLLGLFGINLADEEIPLTTARCIFFRDKRVTSGDSAVLMNETTGTTFVTFTNHDSFKSEWYGRSVCMTAGERTAAGVSSDAKPTCNSYQDIANMDYNQYYIDWHNIDPGQELSTFSSDPQTKEYTIPIIDMRQYACLKLRFQLKLGDEVLTEASQQVPIVVVGNNVDTNDPLFSELVIDKVNPSDPSTWVPSYSHSLARCKDCDVVVLGSAKLTKGPDSNEKDVPEVRNIKVYPGGQLIVPAGTNYTIQSLALRRQEDEIATANIQGTITFKAPAAAPAPRREEGEAQHAKKAATGTKSTYFDLRIDPTNWHFISLPYDVNVSDIRFANPEETAIPVLGTDYLLQWYDGDRRAATKNDDAWEPVAADATLKAGLGYIFALPGSGKVKREFRFPMDNEVITQDKEDKIAAPVYGYGCDQTSLGSNHKGWNLVGAPYLMPYQSEFASPLRTGKIVEDYSPGHMNPTWDGSWTDNGDGLYYIAIPINNGWDYYYQDRIANYKMQPFTSYFVQIDAADPANPDPSTPQGVGFDKDQVVRSSIVRRNKWEYEEVEDNHPVWCQIDLTNPQGENDKTTVLMSNKFTDDYDMMRDMVKMRGSYYSYYTRPVLASRNNEGEMAFNALPDSSALAGIPLNFFAAGSGSYTISFNERYGREEVKAVMLLDKNNNQWYNLLDEPYSFTTNRVNDKNRFVLSVRVERKKPQTPTDIVNPSVMGDGSAPRKILINNRVYILRGGKIYDVTGKQLLNL